MQIERESTRFDSELTSSTCKQEELESLLTLQSRFREKYSKSFAQMIECKDDFSIKSTLDDFRQNIVRDIIDSADPSRNDAIFKKFRGQMVPQKPTGKSIEKPRTVKAKPETVMQT